MDAKSAGVAAEPLKYQTWFLKVSIHCEGCRRKVKKVLRSIDGVFTSTVDPHQQKVTVTGSVGVETLIRKLAKAGKHAEIWPENPSGKGKTTGKPKKRNEQRDPESVESHSASNPGPNLTPVKNRGIQNQNTNNSGNGESKKRSNSKAGKNSPEKPPAGTQAPEPGGQVEGVTGKSGGEGSGKKKKKKGESDGRGGLSSGTAAASPSSAAAHTGSQPGQVVGQMNLSPTRQQPFLYPETYYPPLLYFATYNNRFGGGPSSCYVSPLPYMCSGLDQDPPYHHFQSPPLFPFEIFSDENANGCCVM